MHFLYSYEPAFNQASIIAKNRLRCKCFNMNNELAFLGDRYSTFLWQKTIIRRPQGKYNIESFSWKRNYRFCSFLCML